MWRRSGCVSTSEGAGSPPASCTRCSSRCVSTRRGALEGCAEDGGHGAADAECCWTVSYTHLTLPTICSV
eukprot:13708231-Alexandrium_andersonii.AAC.1